MHIMKWALTAALLAATVGTPQGWAQTQAQATRPANKAIVAWAAKPAKLAPYTGPNRLIWRLADVLAAHKGQQSWQQQVFLSRDYDGRWHQMAPGEKTKTQ